MKYINFNKVEIKDKLLLERMQTLNKYTMRHALNKFYETSRVSNFENAKKALNGEDVDDFKGWCFDDSDLYKLLEGAGYILHQLEDKELEAECDKLIEYIEGAQCPDGYINTRHTIHPELRWVSQDAHELYNLGHMIEGAITYYHGTGKRKFLDVTTKFVNYVCDFFGDDNKWVPGHQEIELALIKLYELTKEEKYLDLAEDFLANRGKGLGICNPEYNLYTEGNEVTTEYKPEHHQDTAPLEYIYKTEGHAVRAVYMYTGMAMLTKYRKPEYLKSLRTVWEYITNSVMYVTGGIGNTSDNEGFTYAYDLPNLTSYCETCASIGMVYWNSEMYSSLNSIEYLSIIDRELKNGILSGISADGKKFYYDNPLESDGTSERSEWFECSCCPTQLLRFIPAIGNYIYAEDEKSYYITQLIDSKVEVNNGYIEINNKKNSINISNTSGKELKVYLPKYMMLTSINCEYKYYDSHLMFDKCTEEISITVSNGIRFVHSNSNVVNNVGKIAVEYNGYVYCLEECDIDEFDNFEMKSSYNYHLKNEMIGQLQVDNIYVYDESGKYITKLVPYFAWNNRKQGKMKVWLANNTQALYNN